MRVARVLARGWMLWPSTYSSLWHSEVWVITDFFIQSFNSLMLLAWDLGCRGSKPIWGWWPVCNMKGIHCISKCVWLLYWIMQIPPNASLSGGRFVIGCAHALSILLTSSFCRTNQPTTLVLFRQSRVSTRQIDSKWAVEKNGWMTPLWRCKS